VRRIQQITQIVQKFGIWNLKFGVNFISYNFMANRDNIAKAFDSKATESQMYKLWEESGLFNPENYEAHLLKTGRNVNKPFVMTLPPPNANGDLHVGHTCGYSFQDAMGRFARLQNRPALLVAGKDHAGIQTETVYSKIMAKEGRSKWELGREAFYKECYDFCINAANNARSQEKMIGLSADWGREKFTLDPNLVKVVYRTFFKMFEDGLIYRDKYIINQCPSCRTALADIDTVHKELPGIFAYIIYPFVDEADNDLAEKTLGTRGLTVATTRPETMLGDTAVAVNPDDPRYKPFLGKKIMLPIANREIPVITDDGVEIETGMGALKVTPAHSPVDFEIAKKNKLEVINVISPVGKMMGPIPERFIGMETLECSKALCAELTELGLLVKIERIKHEVSVCERCETPIQPIVSYQWFADMTPLAQGALDELELGAKREDASVVWNIGAAFEGTKVIPSGKHVALQKFLQDIRPWCISRQLWWGQKVPVWYSGGKDLHDWLEDQVANEVGTWDKKNLSKEESNKIKSQKLAEYEKMTGNKLNGTGRLFAQEEMPTKDDTWKGEQSAIVWEAEEDVFDTWYSSGQWNFSTMGGAPDLAKGIEAGADFKKYYPTDVMETMYDILFWWVARMMMLGKYMTGVTPFHTVYLHGMVMAADGQKMSKSKNNGVTPIAMVDKYGADALRLWYYSDSLPGTNTPLREEKIKGNRNFVNKIWNASRFTLMNIEDQEISSIKNQISSIKIKAKEMLKTKSLDELEKVYTEMSVEELEKMSGNIAENGLYLTLANLSKVTKNLKEFRFNLAAEEIREFFWHTICDKWIESVKGEVASLEIGSEIRIERLALLMFIMQEYLKIIHVFAPFISEAVWQEFVKLDLAEGLLTGEELLGNE
jgi:valyl-tRNA synthetase